MDVADALRLLLISLSGLTVGFLLVMLWTYVRARQRGLLVLPTHLAPIAAAHALLVIHTIGTLNDRIGEPMTWQTPGLVVSLVASAAAAIYVMHLEAARVRRLRGMPKPMPRRRIDDA